ncbi:MAG TPA: TROVE domain-containing protein [Candidatus Sulfotelmatobacter sp.]|jgi:60 kDa SS-A/Ro ribonucleoprotein|nr:TROVE domain-containing protein [Candidatus Sulfotelmatobacter sp.]
MAKLNVWKRLLPSGVRAITHEGAVARNVNPRLELRRTVFTCLLWEDTFYEKGSKIAERIADLVTKNKAEDVAALAREARDKMQLRHVPLFLARELARRMGAGTLVAETLERVIQRADELGEFVALYWTPRKQPLSAGVKRGLAKAFTKFDAYQLAKYNRDGVVKLRDVLFLSHAKPKNAEQAALWKRLVENTLEPPDTWEVALSAGKDKRETWERLLREEKLGGMAVLRNLRLMLASGVEPKLIAARLEKGMARALPFRFVTAARYAPKLEYAIEKAMLKGVAAFEKLPGSTGLLVDVSGSMDGQLARKGEATRIDAAAGLAILLREVAADFEIATFSEKCVTLPARRGFALRDAIAGSQPHSSTYLKRALVELRDKHGWEKLDRVIVITDEQSHDGIAPAWTPKAYVVNVAPYQHGVSYGNGWTHIDGWSERVVDYLAAIESESAE